MAQVLAATFPLFRDRDLFVHDGTRLRRFRVSAPLQAFFFVVLMGLVAWSGYTAARMVASGPQALSLTDATEARARKIEQRQALIEAIVTGQQLDEATIAAAAAGGRATDKGPLARVEHAQLMQAALIARALDARYQTTAAELRKLGVAPSRVAAVGPGHHIALSTMIGTPLVEVMIVETAVSARSGSSVFVQMVSLTLATWNRIAEGLRSLQHLRSVA